MVSLAVTECARVRAKAMNNTISCPKCGQKAMPDKKVRTRPDGSKWIHYDCESGHLFHRTLTGDPVRFAD